MALCPLPWMRDNAGRDEDFDRCKHDAARRASLGTRSSWRVRQLGCLPRCRATPMLCNRRTRSDPHAGRLASLRQHRQLAGAWHSQSASCPAAQEPLRRHGGNIVDRGSAFPPCCRQGRCLGGRPARRWRDRAGHAQRRVDGCIRQGRKGWHLRRQLPAAGRRHRHRRLHHCLRKAVISHKLPDAAILARLLLRGKLARLA